MVNRKKVTVTPSISWALSHPANMLASGFCSGLISPAPGTWGTLAGWLLWLLLLSHLPSMAMAIFLVAAFVAGCYICDIAGKSLGVSDHGSIVWDEMVAIWIVLWISPSTWYMQVIAVVSFRVFDILKPPPVSYFDRVTPGGFGVMLDDVLAAIYTLLVVFLFHKLVVI